MPVQALYPYNRYGGIWSLAAQAQNKGLNKWPIPPVLGLWGWGSGSSGELGLNNTNSYSSPKQITSNITWTNISLKFNFFTGIQNNGTLWVWGNNGNGQLGLGNTTYYSSPKQVGALTNWSKISNFYGAGAIAIKTDGTLWMWGAGDYGRLGLGNTTSYSSPKQVGVLTTWASVDSGFLSSAAIKTDGTLWVWGYGGYGVLGLGNTNIHYSSPKQVGALTNWSKISVAYNNWMVAIKTDGTLWSWGYNPYGQLGLGNRTYYSSPKQLGALTNWSQSSVGYASTFSIKTDGTLWSWGFSQQGELGLGNTTYYSSPKQVGALTNWSKISGSTNEGVASIKTDATLWSWGYNSQGQLGLGNTTRYSSPKQVGSLTGWGNVSVGTSVMVATGYWDLSPP